MGRTEFINDQFSQAYPPGIEHGWWHVARNAVITRHVRRHAHPDERILEVGCGTGIVTAALRRQGLDAQGVDLGRPVAGLHAAEHLTLGQDALDLPPAIRARYTMLAAFDVIEHVPDPPGFLRALLQAMPNVQRVVVTVPARQELWTSFDDHYGHHRRYDRRMLHAHFHDSGLRTLGTGYFFHALYPAIALNNLFRGRERNIRFTAPAPGAPRTINKVLGMLFNAEARLVPRSIHGSSIIGVAERI